MENKKKNESMPIVGLTFLLRKIGIDKIPAKINDGGFTVLGHYDKLFVEPISRWLEFSPGALWKRSGLPGDAQGEPFNLSSYYPIKILFPDPAVETKWDKFAYSRWRDYKQLMSGAPCMSLVLINLTDAYKQAVKKQSLLENFLDLLVKDEQILPLILPCSLGVFPCIGYSDFCLLMAGKNWDGALKLVEKLHGLRFCLPGDTCGVPVLSTDYMIPAFQGEINEFTNDRFQNIRLMVKVNLAPGISAQDLTAYVPQNVNVFRCSGGSDCLLQAETSEANSALIGALLGNENSTGIVVDIASSLNLPVESGHERENLTLVKETHEQFVQVIQKFNQAILIYEKELNKNHRHLRQANSLRELSASILNVCCRPHAEPLRSIMKAFVQDIAWCLETCTARMGTEKWDFLEMESHVSLLCSTVTGFISDISRSDCFSMEYEKYIHTSVGSSTSLLVAYNHWLIELTKTVRSITQGDNGSEYTFLVTSGGCDHTSAMSAFFFLDPDIDKEGRLYERLPIVTQMSETSLLDFSGTILRCFHECLHFCGNRYRKERLMYMRECVAQILAENIAKELFPPGTTRDYIKDICWKLKPDFANTEELLIESDAIYNRNYCSLKNKIACLFSNRLSQVKIDNELGFFVRNVEDSFHDSLMGALSAFMMPDDSNNYQNRLALSPLTHTLYSSMQDIYTAFYKEADELSQKLCLKDLPETAIFEFEYNRQKLYRDTDIINDPKKLELSLLWNIEMVLSRLLTSEPPRRLDISQKDSEEHKYWKQAFPHLHLCYNNLDTTLSTVTDIFTETFSDVMACKILGVSLEDYLISQVFEDWEIDEAFPMDDPTIYRISTVLKMLFSTSLTQDHLHLTEKARNALAKAINCIERHGLPFGHMEASDLCNRVDEILHAFMNNPQAGAQLIGYIQFCLERYTEDGVWNKLRTFQEDYKKIRLLSIDPDSDDCHTALTSMYRAFRERVRYE